MAIVFFLNTIIITGKKLFKYWTSFFFNKENIGYFKNIKKCQPIELQDS